MYRKERKVEEILSSLVINKDLDDKAFLVELKVLFPELSLYEDNKNTLDHDETLQNPPKTMKMNKVFLHLIYLRHFIQNNQTYFPNLSSENYNKLRELILPYCNDKKNMLFFFLSIILNDLGRTQMIQELMNQSGKKYDLNDNDCYDHERYWRLFLLQYHEYCEPHYKSIFQNVVPSFSLLYYDDQQLYKNQVMTNSFNLRSFVNGESVPYSLYELIYSCIDCNNRYHVRVLSQIFEELSSNCNERWESLTFNDEVCERYILAINSIFDSIKSQSKDISTLKRQTLSAYELYFQQRAKIINVSNRDFLSNYEEWFTMNRILTLSHASCELHWQKICFVWGSLPIQVKKILIHYLSNTGFGKEKAIHINNASFMVTNFMTRASFSSEDKDENELWQDKWGRELYRSLEVLASLFNVVERQRKQQKRKDCISITNPHGAGVYFSMIVDEVQATENMFVNEVSIS